MTPLAAWAIGFIPTAALAIGMAVWCGRLRTELNSLRAAGKYNNRIMEGLMQQVYTAQNLADKCHRDLLAAKQFIRDEAKVRSDRVARGNHTRKLKRLAMEARMMDVS